MKTKFLIISLVSEKETNEILIIWLMYKKRIKQLWLTIFFRFFDRSFIIFRRRYIITVLPIFRRWLKRNMNKEILKKLLLLQQPVVEGLSFIFIIIIDVDTVISRENLKRWIIYIEMLSCANTTSEKQFKHRCQKSKFKILFKEYG